MENDRLGVRCDMTKKVPKVSVIIPTYNRAQLVGRAIRSVLNQTYQDFETIVVDDGSTDNTEEVVKSFNDSRIRYIRHEENRGGSAARNTGIRAARGEYVAFLDSDDEWLLEKLEEQIALFRKNPECGAVYTKRLIFDNGKIKIVPQDQQEGWILKPLLRSNVVGTTSSVVVKRQCFDKVGLFDERLLSSQDWDMWIRIAKHFTFRAIPKPLIKYHARHGPQISTNLDAVLQGRVAIINKYQSDFCVLDPCAKAFHHFDLGNALCHAGEKYRLGQRHLFCAVKMCPWCVKYGIYAFASLFGFSAYRLLALTKRIIVERIQKASGGLFLKIR